MRRRRVVDGQPSASPSTACIRPASSRRARPTAWWPRSTPWCASPADLEALFRRLTERIVFLTQGGQPPELDPKLPPADSGILGPMVAPDDLTITVSLGASLFDGPAVARAAQAAPASAHGAVSQRRARAGALPRRPVAAVLRQHAGHQHPRAARHREEPVGVPGAALAAGRQRAGGVRRNPDGTRQSARNFLGFRDGIRQSRIPPMPAPMDRIVWVGADSGEPDWAVGGSYQAVRIIRNFVERWDRTPLRRAAAHHRAPEGQRRAARRHRASTTCRDYAATPTARSRRSTRISGCANPRKPATEENLILRRPFNYSNGVTRSGQIDQGLLFIVYQADLEKGFITVQNRLNGEPLEEYIKPVGGGYFFVLPGVRERAAISARTLVAAVASTDRTIPEGRQRRPDRMKLAPLLAAATLSVLTAPMAAAASTDATLDLVEPIANYKLYVAENTAKLVEDTGTFVGAIKAGDLEKAKALYAPTRMSYETVEPIAELFSRSRRVDRRARRRLREGREGPDLHRLPPHRIRPVGDGQHRRARRLRRQAARRRQGPRPAHRRPHLPARNGRGRRRGADGRGRGDQDLRRGGPLQPHRPVGLQGQLRRRRRRSSSWSSRCSPRTATSSPRSPATSRPSTRRSPSTRRATATRPTTS